MKDVTLCILRQPGEVLLALKKRGFGAGRWNGVGGKLMPGETIEQAAIREAEEEIGVKIKSENLEKIAKLSFLFPTHQPEEGWDQMVHIYFVTDWVGEPSESEEMQPQWFKHEEIPFAEMWPDDTLWLPRTLAGEKLEGEFHFADDGTTFLKYDLRAVDTIH
ncbi:MAG: 8-oxo-dGTP diphosphatase [Candidatus Vogelbacteria bacterium]|nr:8-oxo-dGTP diphosphatase [Candidatus Vogelbacteria bacterium]